MKVTAKLISLLLALTLLCSLAACGTPEAAEQTPAAAADTITVTDHNGNEVTVPADIQRIVVCDIYPLPSVLSVFFDSADKLVGIAQNSMTAAENGLLGELYPEILQAETGFIDGTNVNTEELMKLEPDVVFYAAESTALGEQLTQAGFAAVAVSVSKWHFNAIETLNHWIELLGQMFPANDKAEIVSDYSQNIYDTVQERVSGLSDEERARVFFLFQYSDANITTSGDSFFGQWWADAIGAVNVGEELKSTGSAAVNMEQVYAWNPSLIFITNFNSAQPADLLTNTVGTYDWSGIDAVKNGEVYKMPLGMYRSYTPGVDTPITLLWLAQAAYPALFDDIDITAETVSYYQEVFGITLAEEQAARIFTPVSAASAY